MNNWAVRAGMIALVAGLVAVVLPGIRESRVSGNFAPFSTPDRGSLMVAAVVAIALVRVFLTLDRRAKRRSADVEHGAN
jgi:hypothetical protein